ncbi:hypothetical protein D9756_002636 [Leucocoprinus leucothites]|uniref:Protein kinase domain-containing protein n=1 Tax=Leucocoprinus leucothites TaxID=201217 RepID=A0A8H5LM02_9AGAR|nr:hypothetical protein D9756_002636 [Leucoagaricus leucothites]
MSILLSIDIMTYLYYFFILCLFAVPVVDLFPDRILDCIVRFYFVIIFPFLVSASAAGRSIGTRLHSAGPALAIYIVNAVENNTPFLCASTLTFTRIIINLPQQRGLTLKTRFIENFGIFVSIFQACAIRIFSVFSSFLQVYSVKILRFLDDLFGIIALAILDIVWVLLQQWEIAGNADTNVIRKMTEVPPAQMLIEGTPTQLLIKGPTRLLIERPSTPTKLGAPPSPTRLLTAESPTLLLTKDAPFRKLVTGPPVRLLIKGPPIQRLLTAPLARLLIKAPPIQLLVIASPARLPIEGPSPQRHLVVPPPQPLIEGLLTQRLITASYDCLSVDRLLLQRHILTPMQWIIGSLAPRFITAPRIRGLMAVPLPPLNTLNATVSTKDESVVLEAETEAEVPASGTIRLAGELVSRQSLGYYLSVIRSDEEICWVTNEMDMREPWLDVEDWGLTVICKLNEAAILLNSPREKRSRSLGSDSSSNTTSPDPSSGSSYASSESTSPKFPKTLSPNLDNFSHQQEDIYEKIQSAIDIHVSVSDDDELIDPLREFNREGPFLRNIFVPDLEPVAYGGFGVVWEGADHQGNAYAVKLITRTPENEEMVGDEVRAMKRVRGSQWTVELFHAERNEADLLLVMDWCAGGDLFDLWKRSGGCMLVREAIYYTAQLLLGIHDLHTRGVVHRDIKFENVMLHNGCIKIIDFGLAVTFDHEIVPPTFDVFHLLKSTKGDNFPPLHADSRNPHIVEGKCGTPGYCPPEVYGVERSSFGMDYYAMGIMLHAMLTSDHPYYHCSIEKCYDLTELQLDPLGILDEVEMDFLTKVLAPHPRDRLTVSKMKAHTIFSDITWTELERGTFRHPTL